MRLVSWNIRGGKHPGVVDSAVALEPDVAVLVDCKEKHAKRIINEASSRGYKHHLESQLGYTGIVMISRHPLTQGEIKQDQAAQRWLHVRSNYFDIEIAAVYGPLPKTIGVEPPMNEFWNYLVPACDLLVDRKAVLCGDFNTGVDGADGPPKYRFRGANPFNDLKAHGWRDAYCELHREGGQSWWKGERGFRIDHCMMSRGLSAPSRIEYVRDFSAMQTGVTPSGTVKATVFPDHAALVVDFRNPGE
jgi:exonuclease III